MAGIMVKLCSSCAKGSCIKCGKRLISGRGAMAQYCQTCGMGSKKDKCIACGRMTTSSAKMAQICDSCNFGSKKDTCVVCGRKIM